MNAGSIALNVIEHAAAFVVGGVIGDLIKTNLPEPKDNLVKIAYGAGTFVISGVAAGAISKYFANDVAVTAQSIAKLVGKIRL